jgi:hypothetical protein
MFEGGQRSAHRASSAFGSTPAAAGAGLRGFINQLDVSYGVRAIIRAMSLMGIFQVGPNAPGAIQVSVLALADSRHVKPDNPYLDSFPGV